MRCGVCGHRYGDYIIPHGMTDCKDTSKAEPKPHAPADDDDDDFDDLDIGEVEDD